LIQDGNPERAIEWLFSHPDDNGEDPLPAFSSKSAPSISDPSKPKKVPGSTTLPAKYKLKAFISHKGPSVHSGHYVAHIRLAVQGEGGRLGPEEWVLFNDEKVVKADDESVEAYKKLAYLYVFEKV
jgi:ubiquitin carboxyl-terminal hydrolase 5/13